MNTYDQYRAEAERQIALHNASLARLHEQLQEFHHQLADSKLSADRYDAERERIAGAAPQQLSQRIGEVADGGEDEYLDQREQEAEEAAAARDADWAEYTSVIGHNDEDSAAAWLGLAPADLAHDNTAAESASDAQEPARGWPIESLGAVAAAMREALENPAKADQAPRLTAEQARAATQAAAVGDDPSASTYARHLLARHHTIAELENLHGTGAVDPDKLLHVVNQMRQLAANSGYTAEPAEERAHIERAADTAAAELAAATALDRLATRPADDASFRLDQAHEHDYAQEAGL